MSKKNKEQQPLTEEQLLARAARKRKLRHGAYATVMTVVFVAVVVLFNIVATVLADRFPLQLDLTGSGDYTINEENATYVKGITRDDLDVTIVVCANEAEYSSGDLSVNYYDPSSGKYFVQSAALLKEYTQINRAIHVVYIDPSDPDFNTYSALCPGENFVSGDLLLTATFTKDGEKVSRWRHLEMEDLFEISYDQNDQVSYQYAMYYGMMTLMSSKLETQVTSALASLTSDKVFQVAVLTHNGGTAPEAFQSLMEQNNYVFTEVKNLNEEAIPEDADVLIIATPVYDYTEAELARIDEFLDNDGKLGKSVLYIADASQPDMPNLNEFLSEWGFSVLPGTMALDTDTANQAYAGTYLFKLTESSNDYTGDLSEKDYVFYTTNSVAIQRKDPSGTRENDTLLSLADTAKAVPTEAQSIDEAVADGPFVALGICRLTPTVIEDLTNVSRSYVMVCSSASFFPIGDYSAKVGNIHAAMNAFDTILGKEDLGIRFDARSFSKDQFDELPSTAKVNLITGALVVLVLGALIVTAVVITKRRRQARRKRK